MKSIKVHAFIEIRISKKYVDYALKGFINNLTTVI
jgi:hypothetical protein